MKVAVSYEDPLKIFFATAPILVLTILLGLNFDLRSRPFVHFLTPKFPSAQIHILYVLYTSNTAK
jgi:hypothetical protein